MVMFKVWTVLVEFVFVKWFNCGGCTDNSCDSLNGNSISAHGNAHCPFASLIKFQSNFTELT